MNNKPRSNSTTGIKYLNVDSYKKFGRGYVVRVQIVKKYFIVWRGNNFEIGKKVARKVQELMSKSPGAFAYWYDYEREDWLIKNGYKDANS